MPRDGLPGVTHDDISSAITALSGGSGAFAVDTERAMGIRYSARAYLIQIRRPGAGTFLIDPVGIEDQLEPLAHVMHAQWILHDAAQDLPAMRELGLEPTSLFDTEIAGLLLGFEHISLQAMVAELLGYELAKEHSAADWSMRPIPESMRAYAALDVELLHELKHELTLRLGKAQRLEWFEQECEYIRTQPSPAPKPEPWRRIAGRLRIEDVRALGMLRELWAARDSIAQSEDIAPSKVFPSSILGELARRKPRSRADVVNSPLMRSQARKPFVDTFWTSINRVWKMPSSRLPSRTGSGNKEPFPPIKQWGKSHPDAAQRLDLMRARVFECADTLGIRQEVLLKPMIQKQLAWKGWADRSSAEATMRELGARPWQIENVSSALFCADTSHNPRD